MSTFDQAVPVVPGRTNSGTPRASMAPFAGPFSCPGWAFPACLKNRMLGVCYFDLVGVVIDDEVVPAVSQCLLLRPGGGVVVANEGDLACGEESLATTGGAALGRRSRLI
jgi:hypothetical protein